MLFISSDRSAPSADGRRPRRWTGVAALLAGMAVLVLFALSMLFLFTTDPSRPMLDEIDQHMVGQEWAQAEALCRRRIGELTSASSPDPGGSSWTNRVDPSRELDLRLGVSLSMLEHYDEARRVLDGAIGRHPRDERLLLNRALIEYRTGNLDDALARLQDLARQAKYAPHVHYHIGRIHEAGGRYDEALQAYRDELNISSSAGAWQRYLVLKKMRGATTTRPVGPPLSIVGPATP